VPSRPRLSLMTDGTGQTLAATRQGGGQDKAA